MAEVRPQDPADPRVYFAAERTLLAWLRTGLAMMGFGFVVARFGLFIRELSIAQDLPPPPEISVSLLAGTALILLGVAVNIGAAVAHLRTLRRLQRAQPLIFGPVSMAVAVSFSLALIGLLMAAYLVALPRS